MKKVNFSFLIPHFSPRNEKLEKNENENFSFSLQPIDISDFVHSRYEFLATLLTLQKET